jgi:hypothetical protein
VLTAEQAAFVQGDVDIFLASRDEELVCDVVRVFGAVVDPDGKVVTLYLPDATSGRTLANARKHPRLAAVFANLLDYRTLQIKGTCMDVRPATSADRGMVQRYREAYLATAQKIGLLSELASRWVSLPCTALELRAEEIYGQSPTPGAGALA